MPYLLSKGGNGADLNAEDSVHTNYAKGLIRKGYAVECPACAKVSAFAWDDVRFDVKHMPTCSAFDLSCGHCGAYFCEADSPINAPCYTHSED